MSTQARRTFAAEQKADAVRLVRAAANVAKVAREPDIGDGSLRN